MKSIPEITREEFFIRIFFTIFGVFIFAAIISICGGFQIFSIALFTLGVLLSTIGAYLPGMFSITHESEKYYTTNDPNLANDHIIYSLLENAKATSGYSPENIVFYSGLIILFISLPFICNVMYS